MLFLFGGAFIGLSDIVAKKMGYKGKRIGFRSNDDNQSEYEKAVQNHEILSQAPYDIILESIEEYGILTELLGRIPSIVALAPLSKEELRRVLLDTEHSPIKIQKKLFADNGYQLIFTEAFIDSCIEKAFTMATGARALKSIIRLAVSEAAFDLLGEPTEEIEEEIEIINFKGSVVIDSMALVNPLAYEIKDVLIEDKNIELSISI
jgi:ATP-dependent Clp protease ATP-binding subunit ClpX